MSKNIEIVKSESHKNSFYWSFVRDGNCKIELYNYEEKKIRFEFIIHDSLSDLITFQDSSGDEILIGFSRSPSMKSGLHFFNSRNGDHVYKSISDVAVNSLSKISNKFILLGGDHGDVSILHYSNEKGEWMSVFKTIFLDDNEQSNNPLSHSNDFSPFTPTTRYQIIMKDTFCLGIAFQSIGCSGSMKFHTSSGNFVVSPFLEESVGMFKITFPRELPLDVSEENGEWMKNGKSDYEDENVTMTLYSPNVFC